MNNSEFGKIYYDGTDERCYDFGSFTGKQKKDKYGDVKGKIYLYTKGQLGVDYYAMTAFAVFSSISHIKQFMKRPEMEVVNR